MDKLIDWVIVAVVSSTVTLFFLIVGRFLGRKKEVLVLFLVAFIQGLLVSTAVDILVLCGTSGLVGTIVGYVTLAGSKSRNETDMKGDYEDDVFQMGSVSRGGLNHKLQTPRPEVRPSPRNLPRQ